MANGFSRNGDSMMVLSFRITAPDEKRDDILKSLRSLVGPTSAEAACVACRVFQETDNPNAITFVQAWGSSEALQRHVRSHQYRQLLSVVDLSHTNPEIRLDEVSAVDAGIDVLASMATDSHQKY